jgi:hypothetical protein
MQSLSEQSLKKLFIALALYLTALIHNGPDCPPTPNGPLIGYFREHAQAILTPARCPAILMPAQAPNQPLHASQFNTGRTFPHQVSRGSSAGTSTLHHERRSYEPNDYSRRLSWQNQNQQVRVENKKSPALFGAFALFALAALALFLVALLGAVWGQESLYVLLYILVTLVLASIIAWNILIGELRSIASSKSSPSPSPRKRRQPHKRHKRRRS